MNNYYDYPYPNNYDESMYPTASESTLVNPSEGLKRGNMFDNLYHPYTNMEPFNLTPKNEKEALLNKVREYKFAMIDLNLYLDIYSNDHEKIDLYNRYLNEYKKYEKEYERLFGPLTTDSEYVDENTWNWSETPWPWEVQ
jgi:spore coat protein JB